MVDVVVPSGSDRMEPAWKRGHVCFPCSRRTMSRKTTFAGMHEAILSRCQLRGRAPPLWESTVAKLLHLLPDFRLVEVADLLKS